MHEKTNESSGNTAHYLCSTTVFITSHLFPFARSHTRLRRRQKFSRSTHTHKRLFFFFLVTMKYTQIGRGFAFFFLFLLLYDQQANSSQTSKLDTHIIYYETSLSPLLHIEFNQANTIRLFIWQKTRLEHMRYNYRSI